MKKVGIVRHNDLDGVASEIAVRMALPVVKSLSVNYLNVDEKIEEMLNNLELGELDSIIISDISPKSKEILERIDKMVKEGCYIRLIDHHDTSINFIGPKNYSWAYLTHKVGTKIESGSSLTMYFLKKELGCTFNEATEEFVELSRSYDVWEWVQNENFKARDLNTLLYQYGEDDFISKYLNKLPENICDFDEIDNMVLSMEERRCQQYVDRKIKSVKQVTVDGFNIAYVYAESYINDLAMKIYSDDEKVDIVAVLNGLNKVSLRSNKPNVSIQAFAERYTGGGGSKSTGGFNVPAEFVDKTISDIFNRNF